MKSDTVKHQQSVNQQRSAIICFDFKYYIIYILQECIWWLLQEIYFFSSSSSSSSSQHTFHEKRHHNGVAIGNKVFWKIKLDSSFREWFLHW